MSRWLKLLIGLAASLLAAWLSYGPLGRGAAFIDRLEADAKAVVERVKTENRLPGVAVRMSREPLARMAILSGPANDLQRCGTVIFSGPDAGCTPREQDVPGLNGRVGDVPGMAGVLWVDEPSRRIVPLLAECLALAALAWLIGLGIGWLVFRPRRKREGYL